MGKLITIELACDWPDCGHREPEHAEPSTIHETTLSINAVKPRLFLLCAKHREELLSVVQPLIDSGLVANKTARTPIGADGTNPRLRKSSIEHPCQVEGCGRNISGRVGMAQHSRRTHGFESLAAYEAKYGPLTADHRT